MRKIMKFFFWSFAVIGFSVVALGVFGGFAAYKFRDQQRFVELPEEIVLAIDLNQAILEKPSQTIFGDSEGVLVRDVVMALDRAKSDPRVKGVVARLGAYPLGFAQAQEIAAAIRAIRDEGKFTLVHSEDLGSYWNGTVDYIVASSFEHIWLQRTGGLGLNGLALELPYAKDALSEISVSAEFEQRHEFKGGADMFTESSMPFPVRRNMSRLLDTWTDLVEEELVRSGRIEEGTINAVFNNGPYLAEEALEQGLIDAEGYWDEAEAFVINRTSDDAEMIEPAEYLSEAQNGPTQDSPTIALVYGVGPIVWDDGSGSIFDSESFDPLSVAEALEEARLDDGIDAVVLRVVSPGGGYAPSDEVWRQVKRLRESDKPVVVVMGDIAASGGYFVAMDGNRVIAPSGAITGSIGVYSGKFATEALWNRLGVNWDGVAVGRNAGMWSEVKPLERSGRLKFAQGVDFVYDDFTSKVQQARDLDSDAVDRAARGRIWTGRDAVSVGLIDGEGGWIEAISLAREEAGIGPDEQVRFVDLPHPPEPWEQLVELLDGGDPFSAITTQLVRNWIGSARNREAVTLAERLSLLQTKGQLQMPPLRLVR